MYNVQATGTRPPTSWGKHDTLHKSIPVNTMSMKNVSGYHPSPSVASSFGTGSPKSRLWSTNEHERFVQSLEHYGSMIKSSGATKAWLAITSTVGTRTLQEVKMHAKRYLAQLQAINAQRRKEFLHPAEARWTAEEDQTLHELLCAYKSTGCPPWNAIAAHFPGKNVKHIKERYEKLYNEVVRSKSEQHFNLDHKPEATFATDFSPSSFCASGNYPSAAHRPFHVNSAGAEYAIVFTPEEEESLARALEEARIPASTPSQVLASVATAVSSFAHTRNKRRPSRRFPVFSKDQARLVLENIIKSGMTNVQSIIKELVSGLQIHASSLESPRHFRTETDVPYIMTDSGLRNLPAGSHSSFSDVPYVSATSRSLYEDHGYQDFDQERNRPIFRHPRATTSASLRVTASVAGDRMVSQPEEEMCGQYLKSL